MWVTHTLKNNKGRGLSRPPSHKEDAVNIENIASEIPEENEVDDSSQQSKGDNTSVSDLQSMDNFPCAGSRREREEEGKEKEGPSSAVEERARKVPAKKKDEEEVFPGLQPASTYEKVRLVSRMWRKPEGGLNRPVLREHLQVIMQHLLFHPGCSLAALARRFYPIFTPVNLLEILEVFEELGCVQRRASPKHKPASLFSRRAAVPDTSDIDLNSISSEELLFEPTIDCILQLGQFLHYVDTRLSVPPSSLRA